MEPEAEPFVLLIGSGRGPWTGVAGALRRKRRAVTVTSAGEVDGALAMATALQPELALVEAAAALPVARLVMGLNAHCPACKVVLLGELLPREEHARLRGERVHGYVTWEDLGAGGVQRLVRMAWVAPFLLTSAAVVAQARTLAQLGWREGGAAAIGVKRQQVLQALISGYKVCEVAGILGMAEGTVKHHVAELQAGLEAPTQAVLGFRAAQLGIVPWTRDEQELLERARDERLRRARGARRRAGCGAGD